MIFFHLNSEENVANVQRLITGQNLNFQNRRGLTPLGVAVEKGELKCYFELMKTKVNRQYIHLDNERITDLLIQNGANVNYAKGILKTAVQRGILY